MRRRSYLRLAAAGAGGLIALLLAAPGHTASETVPIRESHVPTTAAAFQQECDGPFSNLPADQDGWHFVLPGATGDAFESLTLTYGTPGGTATVLVTSRDKNAPSSGSGWSGYISASGGSGKFMHAWVFTEANWTLTAGKAKVTNVKGKVPRFNLSHTCVGDKPTPGPTSTPTSSPTATPTSTPTSPPEATPTSPPESTPAPGPTVSPTGPPAGTPGSPPSEGDRLPITGSPMTALLVLGGAAALTGLGLLMRRRLRFVA